MRGKASLLLERVLLVVGVACLGWYVLVSAEAKYQERRSRDAIERAIADVPLPPDIPDAVPAKSPPEEISASSSAARDAARVAEDETIAENLVGMLEIPRLKMSTPVVEGDDDKTLRAAVGHLPDTPQPWEAGNSAIAAHRDGLFRPLKNIRIGDDIRVRTRRGELRYKVRTTRIVKPSDLSVLEQSDDHALTLITCYPFYYVGSAPKRFIVRAERVP